MALLDFVALVALFVGIVRGWPSLVMFTGLFALLCVQPGARTLATLRDALATAIPTSVLLRSIAIVAIVCGVAAFGRLIVQGVAGRGPMPGPLVATLALIALVNVGAGFFVPRR